jgi:hypothetical protein
LPSGSGSPRRQNISWAFSLAFSPQLYARALPMDMRQRLNCWRDPGPELRLRPLHLPPQARPHPGLTVIFSHI